jgi:hypothetical protein
VFLSIQKKILVKPQFLLILSAATVVSAFTELSWAGVEYLQSAPSHWLVNGKVDQALKTRPWFAGTCTNTRRSRDYFATASIAQDLASNNVQVGPRQDATRANFNDFNRV